MIFRVQEVVKVWCWAVLAAPNFDDLSLFEYHRYIKMKTPIGISGKSGIWKRMLKIISTRAELPYAEGL